MSKYQPLWEYIKAKSPAVLTFDEVEGILGFKIDHSFLNCKKELLLFGYQVSKISLKEKHIAFSEFLL